MVIGLWPQGKIAFSFGWAQPRPYHASFIARSSCPNMCGNSSSLGTNVTVRSLKPLSSRDMWRDFTSMLGLANTNGTWDLMWTSPYVGTHFLHVPSPSLRTHFRNDLWDCDLFILIMSSVRRKYVTFMCPGLDHIFIQLGPAPPLPRLLHCSVFLPTPAWELFLVGNQCDNTRSKLQILKLTPLSLFPRQLMKFLHMSKKLNDLSDHVLSHWFPMRKSSQACAGWKKAWERPNLMKMWSSPGLVCVFPWCL